MEDITKDLSKVIIIGDRVLVKPKSPNEQTKSGLFLPPGVHEKENVLSGYVMKVGPGYPIPSTVDYDEPWKEESEKTEYIPLQAQEGDLAIFLQKHAFEVQLESQKYFVVPHTSVLMLYRDDELFS